ncbi:hypothetical protein [aff. Roholtiella sp. LEGE 12411]|uniref:hypothetical protein n=1 Tax=aff. Roholtiella sp. LEGE 12411 TaxID=1828822 RepID=UPI0018805378|nr:hypothetical protein [aff. Roholtiella sp. LEGE 12411]MBE9034163.1 hypothetical protein [aff. Roholtiella sp. LEGE 12411]
MSTLDETQTYILTKGQNIQLSDKSIQTENFYVAKTLRHGGKIRFKIRYRAELQGFCLLEILLIKAQIGTMHSSMSIPNGALTTSVQQTVREFNIWETGDYYFLFKMSANVGKFYIDDYQLDWAAS